VRVAGPTTALEVALHTHGQPVGEISPRARRRAAHGLLVRLLEVVEALRGVEHLGLGFSAILSLCFCTSRQPCRAPYCARSLHRRGPSVLLLRLASHRLRRFLMVLGKFYASFFFFRFRPEGGGAWADGPLGTKKKPSSYSLRSSPQLRVTYTTTRMCFPLQLAGVKGVNQGGNDFSPNSVSHVSAGPPAETFFSASFRQRKL
jgi:hypothetical protein